MTNDAPLPNDDDPIDEIALALTDAMIDAIANRDDVTAMIITDDSLVIGLIALRDDADD